MVITDMSDSTSIYKLSYQTNTLCYLKNVLGTFSTTETYFLKIFSKFEKNTLVICSIYSVKNELKYIIVSKRSNI